MDWDKRDFPDPAAKAKMDWEPDSHKEICVPFDRPEEADFGLAAPERATEIKNQKQGKPDDPLSLAPQAGDLRSQFEQAGRLLDDIVLKKYLGQLSRLEIEPLPEQFKNISEIRFFRITEMSYQKDEPAIPKFTAVFNAVQNLNCGVYLLATSDGKRSEFYMGIRAMDDRERTPHSLKEMLESALAGQFPGIKTQNIDERGILAITQKIREQKNVASVSCIAQDKTQLTETEAGFVQGMEKFVQAMQGQPYTMLVLAKSANANQLATVRTAYENIYTDLSPFASMQLAYSQSEAETISQSLTVGMSESESFSESRGKQRSESQSQSSSKTESRTKQNSSLLALKGIAGPAAAMVKPLRGAYLLCQPLLGAIASDSSTSSRSESYTTSTTTGYSTGETETRGKSRQNSETSGASSQSTKSQTVQLTRQNKAIQNSLGRIEQQLKRIEQCESMGMWECAAYFLADTPMDAEMAASAWRALMLGENSGVETSAINLWFGKQDAKVKLLQDYLLNFIHPLFIYNSGAAIVPVTASTLISGRELALAMGLPRRSLRGFPVIEHAEFGLEAISLNNGDSPGFVLGKVLNLGKDSAAPIRLDREAMTGHVFVCGSTGSGKTNAVLELLRQLALKENVPFLVIEPVKGEYKNFLDGKATVFGSNPYKFGNLLQINPFSFPEGIHCLEHLDRLVEVFNAAWPMYAAMPAVLKDALERAYVAAGWDLETSTNSLGPVFPNFHDLLAQIEKVIRESDYSQETKGDYIGALSTRVRSLTTGLNGLIFSGAEVPDSDLFDSNAIVDLSRIGSSETKALIMGLLVTRLTEYRMATLQPRQPLRHITVLEEAHNLLKRVSTEQRADEANPLGKAVELLANSIAEMRAFGEAFIIVDQSPGMVDLAAIRNTNTKIILRLPDQADRELAGKAANLKDGQIEELARLEGGVAAIYQNNWLQPVLGRINACGLANAPYECSPKKFLTSREILQNALRFALQGLERGNLEFDPEKINAAALPFKARLIANVNNELLKYKQAMQEGRSWKPDKEIMAALAAASVWALRPDLASSLANGILGAAEMAVLDARLKEASESIAPEAAPEQREALEQALFMNLLHSCPENRDLSSLYQLWAESRRRPGL